MIVWRGPAALLARYPGLLQGWGRGGKRGGGKKRSAVRPAILAAVAVAIGLAAPAGAADRVLPPGSVLGEGALEQPRERFHSDHARGERSYLVRLGDLAFSSPSLLGTAARQAGISCASCHVNGAGNPRLFVPGLSTRPGNFDTSNALFNPAADNGVLDPVRVPSLRGARFLGPYGHDGRFGSLRDFVRNVVVVEFAGAEPAPALLDALVAYIQDIDFLPNPRLGPAGRLAASASPLERRGEALFRRRSPTTPASAAPPAISRAAPSSTIASMMSAPTGCIGRRRCSTPTSTRPISMTGATTATRRSSTTSTASSRSRSAPRTAKR